MRFTLRQLQVFVAVAQHESVSRAAQSLALSQSATSTSLTELERQSDCQLFDRAGKRLALNALGRQLLPEAVAPDRPGARNRTPAGGKSGYGSLHVGATLTVGNYLATLLIGSFMQHHPECRVKLQVHNTAHVVQQIAHYELDLGLIEGDCQHPDIEVQPWVEDELVVFCAPQHPLALRGSASLEELTHEAWILREQGSGTRLTFDQAMRHHPRNLNIRLELEHTEAIKRAVESGLGIGCITPGAARRLSSWQPDAGGNSGAGPAPAVLLHLAQAEVPDSSDARVSRTVSRTDGRSQSQRSDRPTTDHLSVSSRG